VVRFHVNALIEAPEKGKKAMPSIDDHAAEEPSATPGFFARVVCSGVDPAYATEWRLVEFRPGKFRFETNQGIREKPLWSRSGSGWVLDALGKEIARLQAAVLEQDHGEKKKKEEYAMSEMNKQNTNRR